MLTCPPHLNVNLTLTVSKHITTLHVLEISRRLCYSIKASLGAIPLTGPLPRLGFYKSHSSTPEALYIHPITGFFIFT